MSIENRIIEINGVKIEVDLRTAQNIESYKIGDNVKVLIESYSGNFNSYPGVIIGFDNFQKLPTIIISYLDINSDDKIRFVVFNSKTEKIEICPANYNVIPFEKSRVLELIDGEIIRKEEALKDLRSKKEYFLNNFNKYFEDKDVK